VANEELVGRIVRISEDLLVAEVTDVGDALHLNAVVTRHEVRQRGNNGGGLEAEQRPVTSNHVRRTKDEVGGSLHSINERVLVGLVVDVRGRRSIPGNETSVSTGTQVEDDLTMLLILKRVGDGVEQNRLSADVVHRGEVLISFLGPHGLQLHYLRSDRGGADLDLVVHDRLITFRVELVGNRVRSSGGNAGDSEGTVHIVHSTASDSTSGDNRTVAVISGCVVADRQLDGARTERSPLEGSSATSESTSLVRNELRAIVIAVNRTTESAPHRSTLRSLTLTTTSDDVEVDDLGHRTSHGLEGDELVDDIILSHVGDDWEDPLVESAEVGSTGNLIEATELTTAVFEHDSGDGPLVLRHVRDELLPSESFPESTIRPLCYSDVSIRQALAPLIDFGEACYATAFCSQLRAATRCNDDHILSMLLLLL